MWRNWRVKCHGDNRRKFKLVSTFELQPIWSWIKSLQLIWYRYGSSEAVMRSIQLNSLQHLQTIQFNTINKRSKRDDPTEEPNDSRDSREFNTEGLPHNIYPPGLPDNSAPRDSLSTSKSPGLPDQFNTRDSLATSKSPHSTAGLQRGWTHQLPAEATTRGLKS